MNMNFPGKIKSILTAGSFWTAAFLILFYSCKDPNSPGYEFMPDMYRTPPLEPYSEYQTYHPYEENVEPADSALVEMVFEERMTARKPVPGTIQFAENGKDAMYNFPYPYEDTPEGYRMAGEELKNPLPLSEFDMAGAKELFNNYCVYCHGDDGSGNGPLVESGKFIARPPAYWNIPGLTEGKIFHSITYGKGMMGAHASQLTKKERWKLVHYVESLIKKQQGGDETGSAETDTQEENNNAQPENSQG